MINFIKRIINNRAERTAQKNYYYYNKNYVKVYGVPDGVSGDLTNVSGDLSDITGHLTDVSGNLTDISGDLTYISGSGS